MKKLLAALVPMLVLCSALPVHASGPKHVPKPQQVTLGHIADASFSTLEGCDDVVVGATVKDGPVTAGSTNTVETVFAFFVSNSNCDIGNSTSFGADVPLDAGEFSATGTEAAHLLKDANIGGHDFHLDITWTGTGLVTTGTGTTQRDAVVTGHFVVDGLDHVAGNTTAFGTLTEIQGASANPPPEKDCRGKGKDKDKHDKREEKRGRRGHGDDRR